ncbi:hypothetical protein CMV30_00140 [Nibricoccus aquaticus]|uniref:Uncharacterized protein n=1 Tax=Nibricoccus aquaticus TaxID=2576891 RepID=A0A290Q1J7_9BACT|nr:hypothetical protein [Nibricoccus aquaticus]ATC62509.1 hypothetical protein CMV30_00140 [Nibricoccus aquaticus]
MSATTYLLATHDPELLRAWWVLVPAGARVVTLSELVQGEAILPPGLPMIVVVEEAVVGELPRACVQAPMVFVGDQQGEVFERLAQTTGAARVCLSREDSHTRLGEFLPLMEEIATRGATASLLWDKKPQAVAGSFSTRAEDRSREAVDSWWDWMGDAVEAAGSREDLLGEFRRMAKRALRTAHVVFFLREDAGYRADRGDHFCANTDALSQYLAHHPVVIDGVNWPDSLNPVVELSIRQRMAAWSVRLIVPLHDNGRLAGWMGLGLRDDGQTYEAADRARAMGIARLLRQMLTAAPRAGAPVTSDRWQLAGKYLPGALILGAGEMPSEAVPSAVRALIAEVRQLRVTRRIVPGAGQHYRASAGMIAETQGVWVNWEDATAELQEHHRRARAERLALLHDLALTLNHELGNSLVSLAALRHNPGAETNSPVLLAAIKRDIASLEAVNRHLASLPTFSEVEAESIDLRALVHSVGRKCGVTVETGSQEILLDVAPKLIEFGLESILESIAENRPGLGKRDLVMSLRTSGAGENLAAVLSIRGAGLALEGILPAPQPGATPTHGRIGVFIAKEIVHLHGGSIDAGTGTNGPEISLSIRQW